MSTCHRFGISSLVLAMVSVTAVAQDRSRDQDSRYRVVDGWAVHGYAEGREIGYQWFPPPDAKDKAEEEKAKMEKMETTTGKYYDKVEIKPEQRRVLDLPPGKGSPPPSEPPPAKPTGIEFQRPKFVDPGSLAKGKGSVLVGKKGDGKIGDSKVTIQFGADGRLVIGGELEGTGKWSETDTGAVYLETALSTFRGSIRGNTVSGLRFTRDVSQPVTEWSVSLRQTPKEVKGPKFWLYDPLGKNDQEFDSFAAARETAKKIAIAGDARISNVSVFVKTKDGRSLLVYYVWCVNGRMTENREAESIREGQEYLRSIGSK
jgi:hypothetical protein